MIFSIISENGFDAVKQKHIEQQKPPEFVSESVTSVSPAMSPTSTSVQPVAMEEDKVIEEQSQDINDADATSKPLSLSTINEQNMDTQSKEKKASIPENSKLTEIAEETNKEITVKVNECLSETDILAKIFPHEKRGVLELVLSGCQGDLLRAIAHFLSVNETIKRTSSSTVVQRPLKEKSPTTVQVNKPFLGGIKSAFTPLSPTSQPIPIFPIHEAPRTAPLFIPEGIAPFNATSTSLLSSECSYPPFFPQILPVMPHFPYPRPCNEPQEISESRLDSEFLSVRKSMMDYRARIDLLSRPEMRLDFDIRPDLKIRSDSVEDNA